MSGSLDPVIVGTTGTQPHWLVEAHAPGRESRRFELLENSVIVGRAPQCRIQLDSVQVSRRHAELSHESGYWKIRDLGSRNGTRVNGVMILTNTLVRSSDQIQIGEFELHLRLGSSPPPPQPDSAQTTMWIETPPGGEFTLLGSAPTPRLGTRHLAMVDSLGHRLLEMNDAHDRLTALCRWMVDSEIQGTMAMALRVAPRLPGLNEPVVLCSIQPTSPHGAPAKVLRSVVDAAIHKEQPILAGGALSSESTVSSPENDRGATAAIACTLRVDTEHADVLYVTVPREFGTVDWLALIAMAVEQFKKAEIQIEAGKKVAPST